jgi:hypothetical protein
MKLNPNCSETVIRLKHKDIGGFTGEEMMVYLKLLNNIEYSDKPVEGYSELRETKKMKAHYYYQTDGNDMIAFAYWLGIHFDNEAPFCTDLTEMEIKGDFDEIQEYLSEKFTEFEDAVSKL